MEKLFDYLSVDIETAGLESDLSVLQIGCVAEKFSKPIEELKKFELLVIPDDGIIIGQPAALEMNADLISRINGVLMGTNDEPNCEQRFISEYFAGWLDSIGYYDQLGPKEESVPFAGKNFRGFDYEFLVNLCFFDPIKVSHRFIDLGNLFWNPEKDGGKVPNFKTCKERAGIEGEVKHTALADALDVVKCIRKRYGYPE